MKKIIKRDIPKICILMGAFLLAVGIFVLIFWQYSIDSSIQKSKTYVQTIRTLIPEPQGTVLEQRRNNSMSSLSIEGIDFVGILEMPQHKSVLPVCADWGNVTKYPCKFSGSVYDRTIKIGATSQKGQYDFYREISVGDAVVFTDTEGNRYTYKVTNLQYEKHANQNTLNQQESALTLFVKNIYDFEYLIVSCDVLN